MIVNKQMRIEFINDCKCNVDYEELEKAINWYSEKPTARLKHIYMFGNYPAVSIYNEKIHVHRLLMMYWLRCKLPSEYFVHHIDENKLNALKENLSVVLSSTHQSKHNKGKTLTRSHREKISIQNHKRKGLKKNKYRQDVNIDKINEMRNKGFSINKIANELNCDWTTVRARLQEYDNPEFLKEVDIT